MKFIFFHVDPQKTSTIQHFLLYVFSLHFLNTLLSHPAEQGSNFLGEQNCSQIVTTSFMS